MLNWTWLTDLDRTERAVDFGSPFGEVAATLRLEFRKVSYVGNDNVHGNVVKERMSRDSTTDVNLSEHAPNGDADVAVFMGLAGWTHRLPPSLRNVKQLVRHANTTLRVGGWLALLVPNPAWDLRFFKVANARAILENFRMVRALRAAIRREGLHDTREYFIAPELDLPQLYVPRSRDAVLAYQQATHVTGSRAKLAHRGILSPLFPALLILARR
jgi:hypothetical protein